MKLYNEIEAACLATGKPWEIIRKRRHYVIFVNGMRVGIFPGGNGSQAGRELRNVIAAIKRAARA